MARELRMLLLWGRSLRAPALAAAPRGKPFLCPWRTPAQSRSPRRSLASSFHAGRLFSSQAAEDQTEEPLHSIISSTETVQGSVSKHEFQAETKKLLDIVARSLYSEKEVFIRELVSNASDALEKLRHKLLSEGQTLPEMEIHLQTDAEKGTITIQDTGIGMTQEELVSNLGTIARSGSKAFSGCAAEPGGGQQQDHWPVWSGFLLCSWWLTEWRCIPAQRPRAALVTSGSPTALGCLKSLKPQE